MELKITRKLGTAEFTKGKLTVDGKFECYTIEDKDRLLEDDITKKVQNESAIPRGKYEVVITFSNRFKKPLPLLLNVNGFSGVRIHSGNSSKDTEGCIIVGATDKEGADWVGSSKVAFISLMGKIEGALANKQKVTLEIV